MEVGDDAGLGRHEEPERPRSGCLALSTSDLHQLQRAVLTCARHTPPPSRRLGRSAQCRRSRGAPACGGPPTDRRSSRHHRCVSVRASRRLKGIGIGHLRLGLLWLCCGRTPCTSWITADDLPPPMAVFLCRTRPCGDRPAPIVASSASEDSASRQLSDSFGASTTFVEEDRRPLPGYQVIEVPWSSSGRAAWPEAAALADATEDRAVFLTCRSGVRRHTRSRRQTVCAHRALRDGIRQGDTAGLFLVLEDAGTAAAVQASEGCEPRRVRWRARCCCS